MDDRAEKEPFINPFQIFPEVVWEAVIDHLNEIDDIRNIFSVFPELKILSSGKPWSWQIGEIMPLIFFKLIDLTDMRSCRLVSKRWKNAVEICVENHTDHILYKSSILQENHFNYHTCRMAVNMKKFLDSEYYKENGNEKIAFNPFPGRNVHVHMEDETVLDDPSWQGNLRPIPPATKLSELSPAMHAFGHHIRNIAFVIPFVRYANDQSVMQRIVKPMFQCLQYLHNLKSIQIIALSLPTCSVSDETFNEMSKLPEVPFQLDVLDMRFFHAGSGEGKFDFHLFHYIIKALAAKSKPKKLSIGTTMWRSEYATFFPNVTELLLGTANLNVAKQILEDLHDSPIRRMWIEIFFTKRTVWEILEILEPHQIESLELGGVPLEFSSTHANGIIPVVSSMKCLRLRLEKSLSGVSFNFLEALPSLEYLIIDIRRMAMPLQSVSMGNGNEENYSNDQLRTSLYNLFNKEQHEPEHFGFLWEEITSLKMLTVRDYTHLYQYARESPDTFFCTKCPRRWD